MDGVEKAPVISNVYPVRYAYVCVCVSTCEYRNLLDARPTYTRTVAT